jgi:hypothetical protein
VQIPEMYDNTKRGIPLSSNAFGKFKSFVFSNEELFKK